jgi:preprotein translocase subunit SecF
MQIDGLVLIIGLLTINAVFIAIPVLFFTRRKNTDGAKNTKQAN